MRSKTYGGSFKWVILFITCLIPFVSEYTQLSVAGLAFKLIPSLHLDAVQFSLIMTAPMICAILFGLIAGSLADRYGFKIVVTTGIIISVIGTVGRVWSNSFGSYFILMLLSGFCVALINANIGKIIGEWFRPEQAATALGIYYFACRFGMFLGLATAAMFPTPNANYISGGIALAIGGVLWIAFMVNKPDDAPEIPSMPMAKYLGKAAKVGNIWLAGLGVFFYWGGFMCFNNNLANSLNAIRGIDPVTAGWVASMMLLGNALGNLIAPTLADKAGRAKPFMIPTAIIGAILMVYAYTAPTGILWPLLFITGFFVGGSLPFFMVFPVALPQVGIEAAGSAGGIIATLMLLGAVCVPSFIIAPLVGMNFPMIFAAAGIQFVLVAIIAAILPEMGRKGTYVAKFLEQHPELKRSAM